VDRVFSTFSSSIGSFFAELQLGANGVNNMIIICNSFKVLQAKVIPLMIGGGPNESLLLLIPFFEGFP
jgi:hypothetical protein